MTISKLSLTVAAHWAGAFSQAVVLACVAASGPARAEADAFPELEPSERLERLFWDCERAAVRGMSLDDGLICAEISEEFKHARFGGDFDALLAYWQERKAAEVVMEPAARIEVAGADMVP
jgi:hypothetical protein